MAHQRIRKFNTKETYPEQRLDNDLCQVVRAGGLVFVRGQVGQDLESGDSVGIGDPAAQAEQAYANLIAALEGAGATPADIVKSTIYVVGLDDAAMPAVFKGMTAALGDTRATPPASTMVGVELLALDGMLIEIEAIAVVGA